MLNSLLIKIKNNIWLSCLLLLFWIIFYSLFIFPSIPLFLGGGQPRALAIIADENNLKYILSFNILKGDGADYQTGSLCVAYENSKKLIVLRTNRILNFDKSYIRGLVSLPGPNKIWEDGCIYYAYLWAWQGAYFSIILFLNQIYRLWVPLIFLAFILLIIMIIDKAKNRN